MAWWWWGKWKLKETEKKVRPVATATILYGRFLEHLHLKMVAWNAALPVNEKLSEEKLDALFDELGEHFEKWFMQGFPPIEKGL